MTIKRCENALQLDQENARTYSEYGISRPNSKIYTCTVCGMPTCISSSFSCQGYKMICSSCKNTYFGVAGSSKLFDWLNSIDDEVGT